MNRYLSERATQFQDFWDIMERRHPGDFQRVATWGSLGDLKNDGYLASRRELFQCYGPAVMSATDAIAKIGTDYPGAVKNWGEHFGTWIFVHKLADCRLRY